jgi:hypothetical protein
LINIYYLHGVFFNNPVNKTQGLLKTKKQVTRQLVISRERFWRDIQEEEAGGPCNVNLNF